MLIKIYLISLSLIIYLFRRDFYILKTIFIFFFFSLKIIYKTFDKNNKYYFWEKSYLKAFILYIEKKLNDIFYFLRL
jgi:hypothetical protein